jgi:hypothetical protein
MVAAPRAVAVEVLLRHAVLDQILAGRCGGLDVAGRADVVGGDRVAEDRQRTRAANHRIGFGAALEERRFLDVGGSAVPGIDLAGRRRHRIPQRVVGADILVDGIGGGVRRRAAARRRLPRRSARCPSDRPGHRVPSPIGWLAMSISTRPASAKATTSGGLIRKLALTF